MQRKLVKESITQSTNLETSEEKLTKKLRKKVNRDDIDNEFIEILRSHPKYRNNIQFPPERLEKKFNIDGISKEYDMPYGLSEKDFENLVGILDDEISINKLFDKLLELNPSLQQFKKYKNKIRNTDDKIKMADHILMGASSKFLPRDIEHFLEKVPYAIKVPSTYTDKFVVTRNGKVDEEYSRLINLLYKHRADPGFWPTIETMESIIDQLDIE